MKRILFVDDEPELLQGLRRSLRSKRREWSMRFAEGGESGLTLLEEEDADIVVSDMRMPAMDGADFLIQVREKYPHTIRLILSGYSEKESFLKAIGPAHTYLTKPCDTETLVREIEKLIQLSNSIFNPDILSMVNGLAILPVMEDILNDTLEEIAKAHSSIDSIAKCIEQDIALSAQVLKLANSNYLGSPRKIDCTEEAIRFMGLETVQALLMMSSLIVKGPNSASETGAIQRLSANSLSISRLCEKLGEILECSADDITTAKSAGMLCHMGTLALMVGASEAYAEAGKHCDTGEQGSILSAEEKFIGLNHADLGGYLANLWGFSSAAIESITHHHCPSQSNGHNVILAVVHMAQAFAKGLNQNDPLAYREWEDKLDYDYLERYGLQQNQIVKLYLDAIIASGTMTKVG